MSVIRETSHVPIAPYVPAAAVGLVHHASRAALSSALVVKTYELCSSRRAVVVSCGLASGDGEGDGGGGMFRSPAWKTSSGDGLRTGPSSFTSASSFARVPQRHCASTSSNSSWCDSNAALRRMRFFGLLHCLAASWL
jgi:hypothetical protein